MRRGHFSPGWLVVVRSLATALLVLIGLLPSAALSATRSWINPAGGNWNTATNWDTGVPGPADAAVITLAGTYTVTLDVNPTVASLTLGAGSGTQTLSASSRTLTLNGPSSIAASGVLDLIASTVNGTGSLSNGGTLKLRPGTIGIPLHNPGSLSASNGSCAISGALTTGSGSSIAIGAGSSASGTLTVANGFTNNGTIDLTNSGGNSSLTSSLIVTSGTLINAAGRSINSLAGSSGGTTRILTAQLDNQGTLSVGHPLTMNGTAADHVNSGVIQAPGGNLTITQSGTTPSFTNSGAVTIGSGRSVTVSGGAFVYNGGLFSGWPGIMQITSAAVTLNTDLLWFVNMELLGSTIGGPGRLINGAQARISGSTVNVPYEAQAGNHTLFGGGTTNLNGAITMGSGCTFSVAGEITGSAVTNVLNGFTNNGTIQLRNFISGQSATLNVTNGTLVNPPGRVIEALLGSGGGNRNLNAQIDNQGTLRAVDISLTIARAASDHLNSGAIQATGGNVTITQSGTTPSFTNSGAVTIGSGRMVALNGGAFTYNGGVFSGWPGVMRMSSVSATLNTDFLWFVNMELLGSTFAGSGRLINGAQARISGSTVHVPYEAQAGNHTIFGGGTNQMNGAITMGSGCTFSVAGEITGSGVTNVLNGFTNNGTIQLRSFSSGTSAALNVTNGTLVNAPGRVIEVFAGSGGGGSRNLNAQIDNQGTIRTIDANLIIARASSDHSSSGAIEVTGGNVTITQSGTTPTFVNSGTVTINSGRTLASTAGVFTNAASGVIRGTGTLNIGNTFTNHGTMAPGTELTPGTLAVTGTYRQTSTGVLAINVGGLTPGTQHDRLAVNGTVSLAGTIGASLINGFAPVSGNVFVVMTHSAGGATAFDGVTNAGFCFEPKYSATAVSLEACSCVAPTIASGPVSTAVCTGHHSVVFAVVADGTAPLAYQWRKNGADIAGANAASYTIPLATFADAGDYDVVVTNDCGEEVSAPAVLTILPEGPDFEQAPEDAAACVGSDVTFAVVAEAHMGGALSYQWRKDGDPIAGATGTTLLVQVDDLAAGGQYDCVVTEAGCGATTSPPAILTVNNEPPAIALIGTAEITLECHSPYDEPGATVTDDCDSGLTAVIAGDVVDTSQIGSYAVTYHATDSLENAAEPVVRVVHVRDTIAPQIALNGASTVTVECHSSLADPGAIASDSCDPEVEVVVDGTVDVDTPGDYVVTYLATDGAGNAAEPVSRTFQVRDTVAPTIALTGAAEVDVECSGSYLELGATGSDACDSGVGVVIGGDVVNASVQGDYVVTYSAIDDAGNEAQVSRTVHVEDTTPPVLTVSSMPIVVVDSDCSGSESVTLPPASASDLCDAAPSVTHDAPGTFPVGTTVVTYRAVDGAGNQATQTVAVQVQRGASVTVLAAIHTVGAGTRPSTTKAPMAETLVRAYSRAAGSCAVQIGGASPSWQHYPQIVGDCTPVSTATTDADGVAVIDLPPGSYVLIATSQVGSETMYMGEHLNNLACGEAVTKRMQLIVANGTSRPGKTTRLTGSELLIIEPEYVVWDDSTQAYPFIFESVGSWGITASVAPPDGFVADFPQLSAQVQTEREAVQFVITEVGSDLVPTRTTFDVTHGRRLHKVRSEVGILLTEPYAMARGFDVAELRGRGLLVEDREVRGLRVDGESAVVAQEEARSTEAPAAAPIHGASEGKASEGTVELGRATLQPGPAGMHVWPSPFTGAGNVQVALALANDEVPYDLDLSVFDVTGRHLLTIPTDFSLGRDGVAYLVWDGGEVRRGQLGPGVYFLRASAPSIRMQVERKLVVVK